jgi:hypothetical protein
LTSGGVQFGIAIGSWNLSSDMFNTTNGAILDNGGNFGYNSSNGVLRATLTTGDTACFALDLDNLKIWFRKGSGNWNGSGTDDPATNTGGKSISGISTPVYGAARFSTGNNGNITGRWDSADWGFTAPSGFGVFG